MFFDCWMNKHTVAHVAVTFGNHYVFNSSAAGAFAATLVCHRTAYCLSEFVAVICGGLKKTAAYYCESIKSGGGESPTRIHFSSFGEEDLHKSCVSQQSFFFLLGCVNTVCGPVAPTRSCSPTGREAEHKMCHSSEKQHVNSLCCQKPLKETQLWNLEWLEFAQWKAGVDQHFMWPGANCGGFIFTTKWRLNGV